MRQVWITKVGSPEVLQAREASDPDVQNGTVRVRVRASGINFADIMARLGLYPDSPKLPAVVGYEISGIVDAVGHGVKEFKEGDRVIGLCRFGGYSDTVVLPVGQVFPLPTAASFSTGAALPVNYLTVYQMLFVMGSIRKGDTVFVHSIGGGVGLAAVQCCKIVGARAIGTASPSKHAFLKGLGVDGVVDPKAPNLEEEVKKMTDGKGVQIVLDPVGGPSWATSFRMLAPTGRLVVFGFSAAATGKKRSIVDSLKAFSQVPWLKFNPISLMNENKAVVGVNVGHLWGLGEKIHDWGSELVDWLAQGEIAPHVDKEFKFEEAPLAHHYIQDRKNIGKVVLVP